MIKKSGEREEYDENKVRQALLRSGTTDAEANEILEKLKGQLYNGITTHEIYQHVRRMLDRRRKIRYGLKDAIFSLGPEGHFFESLIARLFQEAGYAVRVRECIRGKCIPHEVDILAERGSERYIVECKFHNLSGTKCAIQTALYTYARFLDISEVMPIVLPWLVTNTKFSSEVITYASCIGMKLLGWRFPEGEGLESLLERHKLYPITVLEIKKDVRNSLLANGIITIKEIFTKKDRLYDILPELKANEVLYTARRVMECL
ncbi:MAG: ATP cone domain-containing protein [Methanomassiliicoccales archaeon]|nr:ATP cone domain-containing protein [Methanomassiliicoccales archaeon]